MWKTKKDLKTLIDAYFESITNEKGEYVKPPTVTGLALALGTNRQTLVNYEGKKEFIDTIKAAKSRCENWVEENALAGKANPTFSIFNLVNNYGWENKSKTDITTKDKEIQFGVVESRVEQILNDKPKKV